MPYIKAFGVFNALSVAAKKTNHEIRLGTETWYRYLCNRYVLEPNQNADFGATPERSVEIFVL